MCKKINPKTILKDQIAHFQKGNREWIELNVNLAKCKCGKLWAWIKGYEKQMVECQEVQ